MLFCFSPRETCTLLVGNTEKKKKSHASGLMRDRDWPIKKVGKLPVELKHTDSI